MYNVQFSFRPTYDESRKMSYIVSGIIDPISTKWDQECLSSCCPFSKFLRLIKVTDNWDINANMSQWGELTICRGLFQMNNRSVFKGVIAHEFGHRFHRHADVFDMDFYDLPKEEQLRVQRKLELEADLTGAEILEWAGLGYKNLKRSTYGMMAFMLGELVDWVNNEEDDVISDHPSLITRIKNLATKDQSILKDFGLS